MAYDVEEQLGINLGGQTSFRERRQRMAGAAARGAGPGKKSQRGLRAAYESLGSLAASGLGTVDRNRVMSKMSEIDDALRGPSTRSENQLAEEAILGGPPPETNRVAAQTQQPSADVNTRSALRRQAENVRKRRDALLKERLATVEQARTEGNRLQRLRAQRSETPAQRANIWTG